MEKTGAVILSAGRSSRMGRPKHLLPYRGGVTFLEHIIRAYFDAGCASVSVVLGDVCPPSAVPALASCRVTVNRHPQEGRFRSVLVGLAQLADAEFCFIQNVDNPFVEPQLLKLLYGERCAEGSVFPVFKNRRGHPVLIGAQVIRHIRAHGKASDNLREVLGHFPAREAAAADEGPLVNINTPADYALLFGGPPNPAPP